MSAVGDIRLGSSIECANVVARAGCHLNKTQKKLYAHATS